MLITPTKEQMEEIKIKAKGWVANPLRVWINQKNKRIQHYKLQDVGIKLTKEQKKFIKAKELIKEVYLNSLKV